MLKLLLLLGPALAAGALGVVASTTDGPDAYVAALRTMFLGSTALAWFAVVAHVWRKHEGLGKRLFVGALTLATLRAVYVPLVELALLVVAWAERGLARAGVGDRDLAVHALFGVVLAALAGPLCAGVVQTVTRPLRWVTGIALALVVVLLAVALLAPEDRSLLPQRFENSDERAAALAQRGPDAPGTRPEAGSVLVGRGERISTRFAALASLFVQKTAPRTGWGGALRDALQARYRELPNDSLQDVAADLEAAFVAARPALAEPE